MQEPLAVLAGFLYLLAFVPYIHAVVKKGKRPMKSSWFMWASLDTITFAGMLAKGSANPQIAVAAFGCWGIFLLALKYGKPGLDRLDLACLAGGAIGVGLWIAFGNPLLGLTVSLCMTFVSSVPTFVSARKDPNDESKPAWVLYAVSCTLAVLAIPVWTLQDAAQPLVYLAISGTMVAILFTPRARAA